MTKDDVIQLLREACEQAGSQRAWAALHGISAQYVHDAMSRRRDPGGAILAALGVERVVTYRYSKVLEAAG